MNLFSLETVRFYVKKKEKRMGFDEKELTIIKTDYADGDDYERNGRTRPTNPTSPYTQIEKVLKVKHP